MSRLRNRAMLTTAVVVTALTAATAAHVPLQPPGSIAVQIELNVGGTQYSAKGPGECNYTGDASIYQAPGQMWGVRRRDAGRDVNFTLWRLPKRGDMFTLFVTVAGRNHRVNTLQVGPPADRRGSGTAKFEQRGKGGLFTIDAVADTGAKITGTFSCSGFTDTEDNGD